ncbi:PAS domain S-box protein [Natrarchaeobius halalkaliphilus]|uniref:PAS domain S-box protein n=1 Tax=Natrarchaeobius halalkaliphilus TaxID=1679091 RepID=A0A3N6NTW3_9EURY|nr:GAF domain-containing protein [Natrarchaeobius halalkaliphilus]RQG86106.1 PAS domain S-box protein [Natrarchaeobius halalkaliphilus]
MTAQTRIVYVGKEATALRESGRRPDATIDCVETASMCFSRLADANVRCVVVTDEADRDIDELCQGIRSRRPDVAIVAYPADGSEALAGELVTAGVDGYVPQSQDTDVLVSRIDRLLQSSEFDLEPAEPELDADGAEKSFESLLEQSSAPVVERTLETLHELTRELLGADSVDEIADAVIVAAERVFDDPLAAVRCYDDETGELSVAATTDRLAASAVDLSAIEPGDHVLWKAFVADEPTVISRSSPEENSSLLVEGVENMAVHPLGDHGLLSLGPSDGTELDSVDVHLLYVLAATAEGALNRRRVERELVDHRGKIESLHGIASRLDDCPTHQAVYDLTVEAAEDVLNFDACMVLIARDDSLVAEAISSELEQTPLARMSIDEGIAGKTYRNNRTYRVGNFTSSDAAPSERTTFQSVLSVPIDGLGVFQTVSREPHAYDENDRELAELLLSHVTDAVERIDFEEQLRTERDRFAALFENVPDALVVCRHQNPDSEPVIEAVNPAFERIFGYDESELLGEPLDQFIVPPGQATEAQTFNRLGTEGTIVETEGKRRTADGIRDFMVRVVPVETGGTSENVFGLYTDITERKQREKRVEILNRVLRHDLRNGMNIIDGCAEVLADVVPADQREYADVITERTDELLELASKTRAAERTLDRTESTIKLIDLSDTVHRSVTRLERKNPDVTVTSSVPERCLVHAEDSLETAIDQILENAVEHNDRRTPTIEVTVSERAEEGFVRLSIADNGPGLPDDERALLEEDREITQLRHASGLGLWLINWVTVRSGGQLSFRTNEPRGTVVDLEIPTASTGGHETYSE